MDQKDKWNKLKKDYIKEQENIQEIEEEQQEKVPLTPEEQIKFKKQLLFLIWVIIFIILGYILFSVISSNIQKEPKPIETKQEEQVLIEPLPDGDINIYNSTIQEIDKMFNFETINPLYEDNILKLYNKEKIKVEDLDFQTKMLLITSNNEFKEFMLEKTNLKEYQNREVSITKDQLEEISKKIFGKDIVLQHQNFKYYYKENDQVIYFNAILQDNKYIFTQTQGKESSIRVYSKLYYTYKISTNLYMQYQTVFIKNNIVYLDKNMTKVLTNDISNIDDYLSDSNRYEFVYSIYYDEDMECNLDYLNLGFYNLNTEG